MKRIMLIFGLFILILPISRFVEAALPPIYQSIREIKSILDSKELSDALGIEPGIASIVKTKKGYTISNGDCSVDVRLKYIPTEWIGAAEYKLKFGDPHCGK